MQTDDIQVAIQNVSAALGRRIIAIDRKISVLTILEERGAEELAGGLGSAFRTIGDSVRSDIVRDCVALVQQRPGSELSLPLIFQLLDDVAVREPLREQFERGPFILITASEKTEIRHELDPRFLTINRDFDSRYVQANRLYLSLLVSTPCTQLIDALHRLDRSESIADVFSLTTLIDFVTALSALVMQLELLVNQTRYALEGFRERNRAAADSLLQAPLAVMLHAV